MNEQLQIIIQRYLGMTPNDRKCINWSDMCEKMYGEIKQVLVEFAEERVEVAGGSCNSHHITCVLEQIRGAIWFFTGEDPHMIKETVDIYKALDIPYRVDGDMIYTGDDI